MLRGDRRRYGHLFFAATAALVWLLFAVNDARAQGCVASRQGSCVIGSHDSVMDMSAVTKGESWLSPRRWLIAVDYRYFHSHRHFIGTEEQVERAIQRTEVNNIVHILNVAGTYEVNPRFNLTFSMPMFFSRRFNERTPDQVTHATGIGDLSVVGRVWLLPNPSESRQNIAVGFGVKFPTGAYGVTDTVNTSQGPVKRAVDQSIQPGDGGYGMIADFQAYKAVKRVTLYASGLYLSNPRETNGVPTGRSRPSEAIMSVADQYVYRAGAVMPLPKTNRLVWTVGVRGEGVPARDLIGGSNGFRRPGFIISVDPGLIYTRGKDRWYFSLPVAVLRDRNRSVPDILDNRHGDAAFADYTIMVGYSRRF